MAHLLALNVPVIGDPAWSDWAKMTRAKIKSAGIPVSKWQLLYYHMTILRSLEQPAFHCLIKEAEHRYRRANGTIKNWKLRAETSQI